MADINLLRTPANTSHPRVVLPIITVLLLVLVIGLFGWYGWAFWSVNSINTSNISLKQDIDTSQSTLLNSSDRDELLARQGQIKTLAGLISKHVYWSDIFPKLAGSLYNQAKITNLQVLNDGDLSMSIVVPGMADLDKFMQVFDQPQVYKYFYDVRVSGISNAQVNGSLQTQFDVRMKFDPSLLAQGVE